MPETLTWGILSTARINRKLIPAIRAAKGATLVGVASRTKERAEEYAAEEGIPRSYGSYEDMLADPKIDCVYNPLPNSMHRDWTIRALDAGKHVLCEKPFTVNAAEAEEVATVAKKTGRLVVEAFMYRFHPQWERVRAMLGDGELGELRMVRAEFAFGLSDLKNIRLRHELAGGALMDVGCYCLNACRQVTAAEPEWISATGDFGAQSKVDEVVMAVMRFPGDVLCEINCSFRTCYRHSVDVVGSDAEITVTHPWTPGPDERTELVLNDGSRIERIEIPAADEYAIEVEQFCAAARGDVRPRWGVDDAVKQMRAIDAIYESMRSGAPVKM